MSISRNFLINYEAREREQIDKYRKDVKDNIPNPKIYPDVSRFSKLNKPIIKADQSCYRLNNIKIWPQLPFAGTLLLKLPAVDEKDCLKACGFEKNDISSMIRMSKDTGKIQFLLTDFPTKYEKLDYLEPILRELEPPGDINIYDYFVDQSIIKHHHYEYNQLAMTNFRKKLIELEPKLGPHDEKNEEFGRIYSMLKILNMNDAVDELSAAITDNPEHALKLFHKHHVLLDPKFDPLKASKNLSAKIMQLMNVDDSDIFDSKIPPSTEIGEYIMKKLVQNPSSFNAAEHVIDIYAQNDLYKILQSLDTGLKSRDHIVIKSTSDAMNEILDNIWQDAEKTANRHKDIQHGINIISGSLAAVAGDFITNFFGMCEPYNIGSCGLVGATTGVTTFALNKKIFKRINIDEIILSALNPNYLINIYGFNKKYKLGSN